MENKWRFIILFFAIFIRFNYNTYANENTISDLNMEVLIENNGNVSINETIIGDFYSGTELYKTYEDFSKYDINFFLVSDNGIKFDNVDEWNIADNRENKKKKSSIIQNQDGIELAWGIGDLGKHQYNLRYSINGLFKNSELELKIINFGYLYPENVKIIIKGNLDKNVFTKIIGDDGIITKENEIITYKIENANKDVSIYLNNNGIDNSSKKEQIIKIKSNDKTKILKLLKILIFLLICLLTFIIIFIIILNNRRKKYVFKPF